MSVLTYDLTTEEQEDLRGCEAVIERGRKTFIEVGAALAEIRDRKLHRRSHETFEEYVAERWQMSRPRAYQFMDAAAAVAALSTIVDTPPPQNEGQVRELVRIVPEQRAEVWAEAVARNDGQPAPARLVAEVAAELAAPDDEAESVRALFASTFRKPADPPPLPEKAPARDGDEWYTPAKYVEAARLVMGGIDLDPASCIAANETVQAEAFYTQACNGLKCQWFGRVWLNPPYSETGDWIAHLADLYQRGHIDEAIVLVNAKTEAGWFDLLWEVSPVVCLVRGRISFIPGDGGKSQTGYMGQAIGYLGPNTEKFREVFGQFGRLVTPV